MSEEENIEERPEGNKPESSQVTSNPSAEIPAVAASEQPEIVNPQPTTQMEVHHHPHAHHKTWKDYLSEFFMLFLAVFCGFIAENIREGFVEKHKEHEYIHSMIADIKKDTEQLKAVISINLKLVNGIDSFMTYLKANNDSVARKIYKYSNYIGGSVPFENASGTLTQLKNAGGLRLIKDTASVNAITDYDETNALVKKQGDAVYKQTLDLLQLEQDLFDFSIVKQLQQPGVDIKQVKFYIKNDSDKLRLLYNKCFIQVQLINGYMSHLKNLKTLAAKTLKLFKEKYHLQNE